MNHRSLGFDYLRKSHTYFWPKTQATALRGLEQGVLPEEAYIFKGVNVRPIFEEPYDFMELEKFLSRSDLSLDTTLLLMRIFERLIKDPDKEKALFAAESINALEVRYNQRIQESRRALEESFTPSLLRTLVKDLFELGLLSFARPVLKKFYLEEAAAFLEKHWPDFKVQFKDIRLRVSILLELDQAKRAEELLAGYLVADRQNPQLLFLLSEVKFVQKEFLGALMILSFLNDGNRLPEAQETYRFWITGDSHG